MSTIEISVILSTFERAGHLARSLASLACQRGVDGQMEVLVTDDGSRDETPEVVDRFAKEVAFPVRFLTHPHAGFQLAACRNQGVRHARAPYLLFSDGDCIFPPDHLRRHLAARRRGMVRSGDSVLLDQAVSEQIDAASIRRGDCWQAVPRSARRRIGRLHRKATFYQFMRHRQKPKLVGNNIGVWREQMVRINGFDQQFRGWGCEDDDLAARLRSAGYQIRSVLGHTHAYHLWHPPHATTPAKWSEGANVDYLHRPISLTRCLNGLVGRSFSELTVAVEADRSHQRLAKELASAFTGTDATPDLIVQIDAQAKSPPPSAAVVSIACNSASRPAGIARPKPVDLRLTPQQRTPEFILAELERLLGGRPKQSRAA